MQVSIQQLYHSIIKGVQSLPASYSISSMAERPVSSTPTPRTLQVLCKYHLPNESSQMNIVKYPATRALQDLMLNYYSPQQLKTILLLYIVSCTHIVISDFSYKLPNSRPITKDKPQEENHATGNNLIQTYKFVRMHVQLTVMQKVQLILQQEQNSRKCN